jgi:TnpA family transposase
MYKDCAKILPQLINAARDKFSSVQKKVEQSNVSEVEGRKLIIEVLRVFQSDILQHLTYTEGLEVGMYLFQTINLKSQQKQTVTLA